MPLAAKVKVGNITNLSEARYCAGMFVDYLGFPCDGSKLTVEGLNEIAGWVTGPTFVLEANPTHAAAEILQLAAQTQLAVIEGSFKQFLELRHSTSLKFIISIDTDQWPDVSEELISSRDQIVAIHIRPDSNWKDVQTVAAEFQVLVSYSLFSDLSNQIDANSIGVALDGNEEIRPGLKDYDHLADILESLEVD